MSFPQDPKTFTLYNYGSNTATITSLQFTTAAGTQHRADLSSFGGALSGQTAYTGAGLSGLSINVPAVSSVPFVLDYTTSTLVLGTYTSKLNIYASILGVSDSAELNNTLIISTAPTGEPGSPGYTGDVGGAGPGTVYDAGGGSAEGGGGPKVICTALYELGLMDKEIFEYDQAFGLWLYQNDPVAYKGYRMWADILVNYIKGHGRPLIPKLMFWKTPQQQQEMSQRIAIAVAQFVGAAFASEIARRAGHDLPWTLRGWLTVSLGLTVCKGIGYIFAKSKKFKELTQ